MICVIAASVLVGPTRVRGHRLLVARAALQRHISALSTIGALGLALLPGTAVSQQRSLKDQLVGTWAIVSQEQTLPNGSKVRPLGANPKGVNIYNANGSFYILYVRSDLPKIASNNRLTPTPEEAKAIALGSIVIVGTYNLHTRKIVIISGRFCGYHRLPHYVRTRFPCASFPEGETLCPESIHTAASGQLQRFDSAQEASALPRSLQKFVRRTADRGANFGHYLSLLDAQVIGA